MYVAAKIANHKKYGVVRQFYESLSIAKCNIRIVFSLKTSAQCYKIDPESAIISI